MSTQPRLVGTWKGWRMDGVQKITGTLPYGNDWNLPNQAYMQIVHSQIASGTVTSVDATDALATKGVLAVLTPSDVKNNAAWANIRWYGVPVLPFDKIRVAGEEIAAVVAEDPYVAEEACQKIKVTYSPLPFVLTPEDGAKDGSARVYDTTANLQTPTTFTFGDVTAGMAAANKTMTLKFEAQTMQHNNVGTWAISVFTDSSGRTNAYISSQHMFNHKYMLADALGVPYSKVRVFNSSCDGGFGDKSNPGRAHLLAAILSQKIGRPVHYRASHEDNLIEGLHRVKVVFNITVGYKNDGTVTAFQGTLYGNNSAYGGAGTTGSATELYAIYKFPAFKITTYDVYTNTPHSGAQRCVADPAACWVIETVMDKIAASLGMNPIDLRKKNNMYTAGDKDQQTGNRIASCGQPDCMNKAVTMSGFATKWKANPAAGATLTGVVHGIGFGNHTCGHGAGSAASAILIMQNDGSVVVHAGRNSLGHGDREQTTITVAEHMGLPMAMVTLADYDTDGGVTDMGSSGGSKQTKTTGNAAGLACIDAKTQMLNKAATSLKVTVDQLTYALDGSMKIFLTADPTKSVTFASLSGEPRILGKGQWTPPSKTTQRTFGAQVAEVDVDTDTGLVNVTNVYAVHDVGRVLFRDGLETQAHGGIIQGIGMALTEWQDPDFPTGKQLIISNLDLKMPLATATPNIQLDWVEPIEQAPDNYTHGGKGFGEPPTSPIVPAITNAIANAIGWYPDTLPVTPERILKALGKA